jgi:hypothetical protein
MIEVVKALIGRGADVNVRRDDGCTPLHEACMSGSYGVVKYLIAKGAHVNAREDTYGDTPLHIVATTTSIREHPAGQPPDEVARHVVALVAKQAVPAWAGIPEPDGGVIGHERPGPIGLGRRRGAKNGLGGAGRALIRSTRDSAFACTET